jgi:hypothetical protein
MEVALEVRCVWRFALQLLLLLLLPLLLLCFTMLLLPGALALHRPPAGPPALLLSQS